MTRGVNKKGATQEHWLLRKPYNPDYYTPEEEEFINNVETFRRVNAIRHLKVTDYLFIANKMRERKNKCEQ